MPGLKQYGLLLTACLLAGGALAQSADDTLTLINGEVLHGELVDIGDGIVTFRTRHGSRTFLPTDQIRTGQTSSAREVNASDDRTASGLLSIGDGDLRVESTSGAIIFAIADVASVNEVKTSGGKPTDAPGWSVSAGTGVLYRESNRSNVDLYARIELNQTDAWYRWNWYGLFALDDADDFPGYARSEFSWSDSTDWGRHFVLLGFERDQSAAIDARVNLAGGVDAHLVERPNHEFAGGIGLNAVYESFDADAMFEGRLDEELRWRVRAGEFGDHASDADLELLLRLMYQARLHDRLSFRDELRVMPSLTDAGDVRASYDSALVWSLFDHLELNLQLRIDYDDDPPFAELDRWRAAVGAGVRIRFGTR